MNTNFYDYAVIKMWECKLFKQLYNNNDMIGLSNQRKGILTSKKRILLPILVECVEVCLDQSCVVQKSR
uniref:Uncharacterized protein n=1 Tax=Romanomermis culicivorax TaxID=13658 RepID=A0A915KV52_ROMCU